MRETLLYGLPKGATERYEEVLLLTNATLGDVERAKILASKDGFHSFRVSVVNLDVPPDFASTVNTSRKGKQ